MIDLRQRFKRDIGNSLVSLDNLYDEIAGEYTTDRHYHNVRHIENCLNYFDYVAHGDGHLHALAVKAAIYYHDIVYDSKAKDNEEQSAEVAVVRLEAAGFLGDFCERVRGIIMATKHDGRAEGLDQHVMCDVDLAELAADWPTYSQNTANIRTEYAWVSEPDWRKGRGDFMRGLLARPRLYYTEPFHFLFEASARENLRRSIAELEQ